MRKIIEGKVYDTETAREIGHYDNGLGCGDFNNINEALYITPKGNFFLDGEGGPMTKYAHKCGNMTSGGGGIFPMSRDEALYWMEEHGADDVILELFGDLLEDA